MIEGKLKLNPLHLPLLAVGFLCFSLYFPFPVPPLGLPLRAGDWSAILRGIFITTANVFFLMYVLKGNAMLGAMAGLASFVVHLPSRAPDFSVFCLLPFYLALTACKSSREALSIGITMGTSFSLTGAGWVWSYFPSSAIPVMIGTTIVVLLLGTASYVTWQLLQAGTYTKWFASSVLPLTEIVRTEVFTEPLPGLLIAHSVAGSRLNLLAPYVGEYGVSCTVSIICLALALCFRRHGRAIALLVTSSLLFFTAWGLSDRLLDQNLDSSTISESMKSGTRICAVQDRDRGKERGMSSRQVVVDSERHLRATGCDLVAYPEYSIRVMPEDIIEDLSGMGWKVNLTSIIGASIWMNGSDHATNDQYYIRNVVCLLLLEEEGLRCVNPKDKLFPAPLGESNLFEKDSLFRPVGAWLTRKAIGHQVTEIVSSDVRSSIQIGTDRAVAVAICWEVLFPDIFNKKGVGNWSEVQYLISPSDLRGFGLSVIAIEQFRRAGIFHALRYKKPFIFASTFDPFVVLPDGSTLMPIYQDKKVLIWDLPSKT